jgi:formylmethanofuran dehydrogenase subunit B
MSSVKFVCSGCSCLCDDIEIELEGNQIQKIKNACVRGAALLSASDKQERRATCLVNGEETFLDKAIREASHLLQQAPRRLIFGLDNSTLEAQAAGIELAQALGAVIDDTSSFCHGPLIESILTGALPSGSLSQIKDTADLFIYWGSNAHQSHPRHLSKFFLPFYTELEEAGWVQKATLSCVEVRDSETSSLCDPVFKLPPAGDRDFIAQVLNVSMGGEGTAEAKAFVELIKKSHFGVIFAGLGLTYSLDGDYSLFAEMVQKLSQWTRLVVIPMVGHFNMRGFNQSLYKKTGYINRMSFANGISHREEFGFLEQVRNHSADCVLVIGSDPFSSLPHSLMRELEGVPIICLDPFVTTTTKAAQVVFGTAISGLEVGGRAIRMDGDEIALPVAKLSNYPSDEEILKRLAEKVR